MTYQKDRTEKDKVIKYLKSMKHEIEIFNWTHKHMDRDGMLKWMDILIQGVEKL